MRLAHGARLALTMTTGLVLATCSDAEGSGVARTDCAADAPLLAFDHDTTDPDRGIGGGVPEVSVVSADGEIEMITGSWVASQAAFAPDGDRLVVVKADGDYESAGPDATALWLIGRDGSDPQELTGGDVLDEDPDWSADGASIVFVRITFGAGTSTRSIAAVPVEGGSPVELYSTIEGSLDEPVWSPDGRRIAFVRSVESTSTDHTATQVWTMAADGTGARPLIELPYVGSLDWSPDGTTLLVGPQGSEGRTYVVDPDTGEADDLGTGVVLPAWAHDGESIYAFQDPDGLEGRDQRIVRAHIEDGDLVPDRTVLDSDELAGTVLEDVGFYPGFTLDVGPCG